MKSSNPLSENASEIKRGRGRPSKYAREDSALLGEFEQMRGKSLRTRQTYILAGRAIRILQKDEQRFAYLLKPVRITILAELGRFTDARAMLPVANEICVSQLNGLRAVGLARRLRGTDREPSVDKLRAALQRTIKKHCDRY